MKRFGFLTGLLVILLLLAGANFSDAGLGDARISYIEGDVQVKPEDSSDWLPASVNMPVREGDRIWVPDGGRAEVQAAGGSQVRLDERTSFEVLNLGTESAQFYLTEGSAYINFRDSSNRLMQIDTPLSSLRVYERSSFGVDVDSYGDTDLSVYKGSVYAESSSGRTKVNSGRMLTIGEDYADIASLGRADEWERWNRDRDSMFESRRHSSRYLPDELEYYSNDLDDNGRWVYEREYGYVWTPTVHVSVGWSPYRHGRWCWIGGDYVWIGYEPWGWAPYHYGRWAYAARIGWFWVPPVRGQVYWGPGYVGWVRTPSYVAWVPLAPRETYYGYGYYGPYSVNIINVNLNKIIVKNVYKNVHVINSVTVQHNDTFVRGRHVDLRVTENPFLKEKAHIGRPDIKPEKETRMAVVKDVPRAKEPPQKIKEVRVKEIKERRPLVREKEKSVFYRGAAERQMKIKSVDAPKERKRDREQEKKQREIEKRQIKEEKKIVPERQKSEEGNGRVRDQKEQKRKDRDNDSDDRFPAERLKKERQQKPDSEGRDEQRQKRYEPRQEQKEQKKVKDRDREPAQDRQVQAEEKRKADSPARSDKMQKKQEKEQKKEERRRAREQKESGKSDSGTSQPAPVEGGRVPAR